MYNSYFKFSEFPFENNLDERFLFMSDDHKEVLAALSYFIKTKKGFAIVCGDVGTGKTMLINSFLRMMPENVHPINISNPCVSSLELLVYIAKALEIELKDKENLLDLTDRVKSVLEKARNIKKQFVLIIDEAHLLSDQALEEIRLLSNIETQEQKLLQILLVGQYELSYKLDRQEMRHLRQRININRFLSPLNPFETLQYIDFRLRQVGSSFDAIFEDNCKKILFKLTEGVPRNINQLCDNALLICMSEMRQKIDQKTLQRAREALLTDRIFTPKSAKFKTSGQGAKFLKPLAITTACLSFFILGAAISIGFLARSTAPPPAAIALHNPVSLNAKEAKGPEADVVRNQLPVTPAPKAKVDHGPAMESTSRKVTEAAAIPPAVAAPVPPYTAAQSKKPVPAAADREVSLVKVEKNFQPPAPPSPPKEITAPNVDKVAGDTPAKLVPQEVQDLPVSAKEPALAAVPAASQTSESRVVQKGDSLSAIATQIYQGDHNLGLEAIILDNPEITNIDLIHPGELLYLPRINNKDQTVKLRDNLYYAYYGRYTNTESMKQETAQLEQRKVRYKVINHQSTGGATVYRVILGGYEKLADLQASMKEMKGRQISAR